MHHSGEPRRVIAFLQENYPETLNQLSLEMEEGTFDDIRVQNPPRSFAVFMENQGYCNRDRFDTYKPSDVLAFVIMAHHKLFSGFINEDIEQEMEMKV